MIHLALADTQGLAWAQAQVKVHHYLHAPVDARCSAEAYLVHLVDVPAPIGCLIFGRPEATRCYPWYGSVEDVATRKAECTRWEVLNLARVWLSPRVQVGGDLHRPELLPGFEDRRGAWRSTLASEVIGMACQRIGFDYLMARPPCFVEEPYQVRWLLSYCDTRLHRGTIYRAAGFEWYRVNARGIETWRIALPPLTPEQDTQVRARAEQSPRSRRHRSRRVATEQSVQPYLLEEVTHG